MAVAAAFGLGLASWLQGRAASMSSLSVLLAILFFGWLWGGWGLLFGAPLIAVFKTVADRIPSLQPIGELLRG
jgi:predicted PurR-regulated permease PerM